MTSVVPAFRPVLVNALYTGIERGLTADILAARSLDGAPYTVCTSHVVASHGTVTDVLEVPADTVDAQLQHLRGAVPVDEQPNGARVGIVGAATSVDAVLRHVTEFEGPLLLDVTLSGPSGEDIVGTRGLDALRERVVDADVLTMRRRDAELFCGMEIGSLDDAQVAVQRIARMGSRNVLLRCGALKARHFDSSDNEPPFYVDLLYHDDEFSLFEAPLVDADRLHGASSCFSVAILAALTRGTALIESVQMAKRFTVNLLHQTATAGRTRLSYPEPREPARVASDE